MGKMKVKVGSKFDVVTLYVVSLAFERNSLYFVYLFCPFRGVLQTMELLASSWTPLGLFGMTIGIFFKVLTFKFESGHEDPKDPTN
jgi:hypothetical protein